MADQHYRTEQETYLLRALALSRNDGIPRSWTLNITQPVHATVRTPEPWI